METEVEMEPEQQFIDESLDTPLSPISFGDE